MTGGLSLRKSSGWRRPEKDNGLDPCSMPPGTTSKENDFKASCSYICDRHHTPRASLQDAEGAQPNDLPGAEAPGRAGSCPPSDVRKTQNLAKEIWEPSTASHSQLKKKQTGTESLWTLWLRDEAPSGGTRRAAGELGMKRSLPPKGARAHDTICSPSTPRPISSVTKL